MRAVAQRVSEASVCVDGAVIGAIDGPGLLVLVGSQFTLYADTSRGRRPTWNNAAPGPVAEPLVDAVAAELRALGAHVETGKFGADMKVALVNDGPITIIIEL